jgi:GT2 family glycosyltransferase
MRLRGEAAAREQLFRAEIQVLQGGLFGRLSQVLRRCRRTIIPAASRREQCLHFAKQYVRFWRRDGLPALLFREACRGCALSLRLARLPYRARGAQPAPGPTANGPGTAAIAPLSGEDGEILRDILAFAPRPVDAGVGPIDVVVPVYKGRGETLRCVRSVLAARPACAYELIVIIDAGPDPVLNDCLRDVAARRLLTLLENPVNLGFVRTANRGLALHPDRDVLLLNSDTEVSGDWLDRLRRAAYSAADVGTVTPLSNNATICSYPRFCEDNPLPDGLSADQLDRLCSECNAGGYADVPTGVGFCMYFRRDCLDTVRHLDEQHFGKGYGEENDFCVRASRIGWRHLLTTDTFVYHRGGTSFGASKNPALERALFVLAALHHDYLTRVAAHVRADPALPFRRRLDLARLAGPGPAVLYVLHNRGGGTDRHVRDLAARMEQEGHRAILLRPLEAGRISLQRPAVRNTPNLVFTLPHERWTLLLALRGLRVGHVHVHHTIDVPAEVFRLLGELGLPYDWTVHDYYSACPRINLIDGSGLYCGEPEADRCQACLDRDGAACGGEVDIRRWRQEHATWLAGARRVFVPHHDVAARMGKYFPGVAFVERPHFEALPAARPVAAPLAPGEALRVAVIGGIGPNKGSEVLLACARDGLARRLPLTFHVVGWTVCDEALRELPNVTITGPYREEEVFDHLARLRCHCAFFPSVWPETYAYVLSIAFRGGLFPVAFDLGAPAARIRECGFGHLIPLTGDGAAVNDRLLALAPRLAVVPPAPRWEPAEYRDLLGEYYGLTENGRRSAA